MMFERKIDKKELIMLIQKFRKAAFLEFLVNFTFDYRFFLIINFLNDIGLHLYSSLTNQIHTWSIYCILVANRRNNMVQKWILNNLNILCSLKISAAASWILISVNIDFSQKSICTKFSIIAVNAYYVRFKFHE